MAIAVVEVQVLSSALLKAAPGRPFFGRTSPVFAGDVCSFERGLFFDTVRRNPYASSEHLFVLFPRDVT